MLAGASEQPRPLRVQHKCPGSDGQSGYIADDAETCAKYTLKLIQDRDVWRQLGKQAHERVKDNYLFPTMVLQYLDALKKAREISRTAGILDRKL